MPEIMAFIDSYSAETFGVLGAFVGILVTYLWRRSVARKAVSAAFEDGLVQNAHAHQRELEQLELSVTRLSQAEVANTTTIASLNAQLERLRFELDQAREGLSTAQKENAASKARLEEAQIGFKQREEIFRESSAELKKEFEALANKVFEHQEEKHNARLNNVLNPFTPFVDCSLLRMANLYANICQVGARAEVRDCFDMITSRSADILRLEEYGIKIGVPADLVVIDTDQPETAVAELTPPLYGFKRGRMTFKRAPVELLSP